MNETNEQTEGTAPAPVRVQRVVRARAELRADIEAARALVNRLCTQGDRAWRMCVPPQDDDSDILLLRVIAAAEQLDLVAVNAGAQVEYLTTEIAKALGQEPGTPADTVWMVRTFAGAAAAKQATVHVAP